MQEAIQKLLKERYYLSNETTWEDISIRISSIYLPIFDNINKKEFIPSSPTLMNANTNGERIGTLSSCFTMDIEDSISGIFDSLKEAAIVTKASGGVGYVFSKLRSSKEIIDSIKRNSSGPVPFAKIFNSMLDGVSQGGIRRGAGMFQFDIDHPDILDIIVAKDLLGELERMNISIRVTNDFYDKLKNNPNSVHLVKLKNGSTVPLEKDGKYITIKELWDELVFRAWKNAEPGIFNVDIATNQCTVTNENNYVLSNPCQEYVNIPYGSCNLGSINLSALVDNGVFDWENFKDLVAKSTRFLNNIIDINNFPLDKIKDVTLRIRPIGLGVMGYAHCLFKLSIPFNSKEADEFSEKLFNYLTYYSMCESVELAKEFKCSYPAYDEEVFFKANERFFKKNTNEWNKLKDDIKKYGIYNSCNTSIAPTGTISYLANTSSGIEPVFALSFTRKIEKENKTYETVYINDPVFIEYLDSNYSEKEIKEILEYVDNHSGSCQGCSLIPEFAQKVFVTASDLTPMEHLNSLGIIARNTSLSVSKTINMPNSSSVQDVADVYIKAYKLGVIGVTVFRDGCRSGILETKNVEVAPIKEELSVKLELQERPRELDGKTYKIKDQHGKVYVTVNHINNNGIKKPWEIFMYSSNENQEMYAALGKTLSAIMRRNDDISFIIDDLKSIKSSTEDGGYFTQEYGFIRSKPQHIGLILEEYVNKVCDNQSSNKIEFSKCPECNELQLVREGGCEHCLACNYSKCG